MTDLLLNAAIFLLTTFLTARFFYRDAVWRLKNGIGAFAVSMVFLLVQNS